MEKTVCEDPRCVAYGVTTKGNGDAFINPKTHTALSVGGGQPGQGYPCVMSSKTVYDWHRQDTRMTELKDNALQQQAVGGVVVITCHMF